MSFKTAYLHLSDLHLSDNLNCDGEIVSRSSYDLPFVNSFLSVLKDNLIELNAKVNKVIISGDLANIGVESEYKIVTEFIGTLSKELAVETEDFIIIPGNHDVFRSGLRAHFEEKILEYKAQNIKPYMLHEKKFEYFKKFLDSLGKKCNWQSPIFSVNACTKNKIVFIGFNTNFQQSYENAPGWIEAADLDNKIQSALEDYSGYARIGIFHHPPPIASSGFSPISTIKNWGEVSSILVRQHINFCLYGHTHINNNSEHIENNDSFKMIGTGSFAKSGVTNTCKIFIVDDKNEEDNISLRERKIVCDNGDWDFSQKSKTYFVYYSDNCNSRVSKDKIEGSSNINEYQVQEPDDAKPIDTSFLVAETKCPSSWNDAFVDIIKRNNLYSTGHYHWGPNSRSLGCINTNQLLGNFKLLEISKYALYDTFKKHFLHGKDNCFLAEELFILNSSAFIGIGIEGNILCSNLALKFNLPYTYIPAICKEKDHNKFEKHISIKPQPNMFLVTDVVSSGSTVKNIIKNIPCFKSEIVKKIYILCLFSVENFESEDKRVEIHPVCSKLEVNKCPHKREEDCPLHELGVSHKLY